MLYLWVIFFKTFFLQHSKYNGGRVTGKVHRGRYKQPSPERGDQIAKCGWEGEKTRGQRSHHATPNTTMAVHTDSVQLYPQKQAGGVCPPNEVEVSSKATGLMWWNFLLTLPFGVFCFVSASNSGHRVRKIFSAEEECSNIEASMVTLLNPSTLQIWKGKRNGTVCNPLSQNKIISPCCQSTITSMSLM